MKKLALNDITFGINKKTCFGLVGPNGAGKSTTFNIILNKVIKSSGSVKLYNMKNYSRSSLIDKMLSPSVFEKNNFGISFQGNALWDKMTVHNNLYFYA